jgi:hypothetical protein
MKHEETSQAGSKVSALGPLVKSSEGRAKNLPPTSWEHRLSNGYGTQRKVEWRQHGLSTAMSQVGTLRWLGWWNDTIKWSMRC